MKILKNILVLFFVLFLFSPSLAVAAVGYDGTGDSHTIDNPNRAGTTFTVCGWIWTATWQDSAAVAAYANGTASSAGRGWNIRTRDNARLQMRAYAGAVSAIFDSPVGLPTSTWIHFCVVNAGASEDFYIDATDGVSDATDFQMAPTVQDATDDFIIGTQSPDLSSPLLDFNGILADLAYWDTALTTTEVSHLADKTVCPGDTATSNLQFFSRLTTAGAVTDIGPNSFTIVEAGNPTTQADPGGLPTCGGGAPPGAGGGSGAAFNEGFEP